MKLVILPSLIVAVILISVPDARAQSTSTTADQPDYFGKKTVPQKVSFRQTKPRTRRQHIILGSLFGGAALFGGIGLYFHLDSRDASNEVMVAGGEAERTYSREVDDVRNRAFRSRTLAVVGYSVAGAFLVATIVAMAMTQPGDEIVTIDEAPEPKKKIVPVSIAPIRGGAIIGRAWRF